VIFATLVFQGLTLRPLIRLLGIKNDEKHIEKEHEVRMKIASAVIEHIEENYSLGLHDEVLNQIKTKYEIRVQRLRKVPGEEKLNQEQIDQLQRIQQELLARERSHLVALRKQSIVSDEILRKIEYELDLEETRLILEKQG
jgi:CPA1 family monovalent cation:H+ antiporter